MFACIQKRQCGSRLTQAEILTRGCCGAMCTLRRAMPGEVGLLTICRVKADSVGKFICFLLWPPGETLPAFWSRGAYKSLQGM